MSAGAGGFVVLGLVVWAVCVVLTVRTAVQRGRRAWVWAIIGILTGPIGLFAVYFMEPIHGGAAGTGHGGSGHEDPRAALYERPHKK